MNSNEQFARPLGDSESASWAVRTFLQERGEGISPAVLFGLGRSACYQWVGTGRSASLLTYHPDRVLQMLLALNVPTVVHDCMVTRPLIPSDLEPILGRRVLLEVHRNELTSPVPTRPTLHHRYCVWTTGRTECNEPAAWPRVELEMPCFPAPVFVDGQTFARSLTFQSGRFLRYRFFVPAAQKIRWEPKIVLMMALRLYVHEMIRPAGTSEHSGLRGLAACIHALAEGQADYLAGTRMEAQSEDAGTDSREIFAEFLVFCAEFTALKGCVAGSWLYREIGRRWTRVLSETEPLPADETRARLKEIYRLERAALRSLQNAIA